MTAFPGKTVVISGSGNVAIYACEKATELGAKVVAMSDSNGYIYDPRRHQAGCHQGDQGGEAGPHQGIRWTHVPGSTYTRGLPRHLDHPLRHRSALRHSE